jgi:hypothetical protein
VLSVAAVADGQHSAERALRVFVADASGYGWVELTSGRRRAVRLAAPDLHRAQRSRAGLRDDVAVILDVTVSISADFRSARARFTGGGDSSTLRYAGTLDGLAGLVSDIFVADVADGVTLIPAVPGLDVRCWAREVLARLSRRLPVAA